MFHFYAPRKRQKIFGFLMLSGSIQMEHWANCNAKEVTHLNYIVTQSWRCYLYLLWALFDLPSRMMGQQ